MLERSLKSNGVLFLFISDVMSHLYLLNWRPSAIVIRICRKLSLIRQIKSIVDQKLRNLNSCFHPRLDKMVMIRISGYWPYCPFSEEATSGPSAIVIRICRKLSLIRQIKSIVDQKLRNLNSCFHPRLDKMVMIRISGYCPFSEEATSGNLPKLDKLLAIVHTYCT